MNLFKRVPKDQPTNQNVGKLSHSKLTSGQRSVGLESGDAPHFGDEDHPDPIQEWSKRSLAVKSVHQFCTIYLKELNVSEKLQEDAGEAKTELAHVFFSISS